MIKLSIVIPCYNEAKNIPLVIEKLNEADTVNFEVILVNNGSTDNTMDVLSNLSCKKKISLKIINIKKNIGYGNGIMSGIRMAEGEIIAWTHSDLQTDPLDIINAFYTFHENLINKKSILKGKRKGRNIFDAFFTYCMGLVSSIFMRVKLSDINAQPKMFHRDFLDKMEEPPLDFSLDLYLLYIAKLNNYSILEYPVFFNKRKFGESKGGGTLVGKWKLIKRTWSYIYELKTKLDRKNGNYNS